jgi:glycosyltransferase involved in cell wall biosynthesis
MIDIIIPTIGRAHRLPDLLENINAATVGVHRVLFVTEPFDEDTIAMVRSLDLEPVINKRTENYAGAVNTAYEESDGQFLFCGADDLIFHAGWDRECM